MWGADDGFGGAGGGFMPAGQGGDLNSPAASGKRQGRRTYNVMPVTVRQLLDCQEETFSLNEVEANVLTIVGLVVQVEMSSTKVSILVNDRTGCIECVNYVGSDDKAGSDAPFVPHEGSYGRVVGQLRSMKGSKYMVIFRFLPCTDLNELTCHLLELIQLPMKLKKIKEFEAHKTGVESFGGMNNSLSMVTGGFSSTPSGFNQSSSTPVGKPGFSNAQNLVLSIIQSNRSESGIQKDEILRNLKNRVTGKELEKILEDLSSEGHIYSTVDDDHYRSTD